MQQPPNRETGMAAISVVANRGCDDTVALYLLCLLWVLV